MDYFDVIKRALKVTWKYKALWVLGFFLSSGGGGGTSGYSSPMTGDTSTGEVPTAIADLFYWFEVNWLPVLLLVSAVAIFFMVFSVAAQGGIVHLVNEAEENREVRLLDGWRVGFQYWGRTFMLGLVAALPILLLIGALFAMIVPLTIAGDSAITDGGAFAGLCCGLPLIVIVMIAAGVVISIVQTLALRYGVLQDVSFGQALILGWKDFTGKRGAFVFMLVMIIPGMVYGAVAGVIALLFALPAGIALSSGSYATGISLIILLMLILLVPGSAYGAFQSAAWTIFFRRMNGLELALGGTVAPPVHNDFLPPPPIPAAPMAPQVPGVPAPPVMPEPPAPESPPYV